VRIGYTILLGLGLVTSLCHAEARWCSIVGRGPQDRFFYPPIAKAARVYGVVLSRIYYLPTGQVRNVEAISGPPMLSRALAGQLKDWTIKTDATGEGLCESIVIGKFNLFDESGTPSNRPAPMPPPPGMLLLTVDDEIVPLIDYGPDKIEWNPFHRIGYVLERGFSKVFKAFLQIEGWKKHSLRGLCSIIR